MVLVNGKCNVLQAKTNSKDRAVQRIVGEMHAPCFFGEGAAMIAEDGNVPRRVASVVAASGGAFEPSVQILSLSRASFSKMIKDGVGERCWLYHTQSAT